MVYVLSFKHKYPFIIQKTVGMAVLEIHKVFFLIYGFMPSFKICRYPARPAMTSKAMYIIYFDGSGRMELKFK